MNRKKPLSYLILLIAIILIFLGFNIDLDSLNLFDNDSNFNIEESLDADEQNDTSFMEKEESFHDTSSDTTKTFISYPFRSDELLKSHYEKHKDEFNDITMDEYYNRAIELVNMISPNVITKIEEKDGDSLYFDTDTGEFAVLSTDGYIRTFFIPEDGIDYYNRK